MDDPLMSARARVLHDLHASGNDDPRAVSILEDAVSERRWWVSEWPEGAAYVAGQIAQDVQDALLDSVGRWPLCRACDEVEPHELRINPELGPDPRWVCERSGMAVAPLGEL
ncbi:hypothetical protein [Actinopolymorpha alba]|uniref:hypothetical protein n=1 Tax=Actinopolymorpha alba TaxID=533267 RepID=UPI000477D4AE|nr:hypothetical protein [Actinopolymorpha alba]